jgi:hypothetical protein
LDWAEGGALNEALRHRLHAWSTRIAHEGGEAGLFVSDDDSISWSVTTSIDWVVSSVLAVTESAILVDTYRSGVWRSEDGGHAWMPAGFEGNVHVDALTKDASGRVFAAVAHLDCRWFGRGACLLY